MHKSANVKDEARSDLKVVGFWRAMRNAYFDIKVVSPLAKTNAHRTQASLFKTAEKVKIREYKERIRDVEHGDFNPLVFTTTGGMAPQSQIVVKKLVEKMSTLHTRSVVTAWLRVRISFALLRTTLLCVRGTRRKKFHNTDCNIELAVSQAHI